MLANNTAENRATNYFFSASKMSNACWTLLLAFLRAFLFFFSSVKPNSLSLDIGSALETASSYVGTGFLESLLRVEDLAGAEAEEDPPKPSLSKPVADEGAEEPLLTDFLDVSEDDRPPKLLSKLVLNDAADEAAAAAPAAAPPVRGGNLGAAMLGDALAAVEGDGEPKASSKSAAEMWAGALVVGVGPPKASSKSVANATDDDVVMGFGADENEVSKAVLTGIGAEENAVSKDVANDVPNDADVVWLTGAGEKPANSVSNAADDCEKKKNK